MGKKLTICLIIFLAVFLRVYKIYTNGHFHADEARDLVNIHQIWKEKRITLVGPIADDGSYLFSSLTYYLLLPFAVIFDFQPMGTISGAVFWGLITFGCLWWLAIKVDPKRWLIAGILAAVWWPLVEISRWPWNPNLVPLWVSLSLLFSINKGRFNNFLSGLWAGFSLHHHFLAFVSLFFVWLKKRKINWLVGFGLALLPFIIFDLRHPPGLFWSRMILYNNRNSWPKIGEVLPKMIEVIKFAFAYILPNKGLATIISWICLIVFIGDIKKRRKNVYWGLSFLLSLSLFLIYSKQNQYLLGSLPLFWLWLFGQRDGWEKRLTTILIGLVCLASIVELPGKLDQSGYKNNPKLVREACQIIKEQIDIQSLANPNLAVLGSPDQDRKVISTP